VIWQFFLNNLHEHSWYEFSMFTSSSWFIIISIMIFTTSDEWTFSLLTIFLSQAILSIFRSSWSLTLFFINLLMIVFWLLVFNVMCTSYANITKLLCTICAELAILFTHVWNFSKAAWAFKLIAWSAMSLLSSLQSNIIKSCCVVNMLAISWKIWSINLFCIFFISFLFTIFTKISRFFQSNDKSSLNHCFFVVTSSFATSTHNDVSNVKHIFSYVCSCLLRSWMNVFNFCTFFVMNMSWLSIFLSEVFQKCWISFKITSFHEWSLLFSFFNINVCVNRLMMLITFVSSLCECLNLALLSLCNESTLLAIIIESTLLLLMQFIIVYSSTWSFLSHL